MSFSGTELYQLIPQRPPIVMVDRLSNVSESGCLTGLTIAPDNIFVADGVMQEPGIIEHIAQSAAAFAGYRTFVAGLPPRLGYIGEVKKMQLHELPHTGDTLRTTLSILGEAAGITLLAAETRIGEKLIAEGQMKIFLKDS